MIGEVCSVSAYPVRERTTGKPGGQTGNIHAIFGQFRRSSAATILPTSGFKWGGQSAMRASQVSVPLIASQFDVLSRWGPTRFRFNFHIVASSSVYAR